MKKGLALAYAGYILTAGIISILAAGLKRELLLGLVIGAAAAMINYLLLNFAIPLIFGNPKILGIQLFILRYLIYLLTAYICVKLKGYAAVMYAVGIIGLSVAIFITYGIGGMKEQ